MTHTIRLDTVNALNLRLQSKPDQSLRAWSAELSIPFGTLWDIKTNRPGGHVSLENENRVRKVLGLDVIPQFIVEACVDCGGVHERCYGKKLAPPKKRVITRWRDLPPEQLAAALAQRVPYHPLQERTT